MRENVTVVIGIGGIGRAVGRRLGADAKLLIADVSQESLDDTVERLGGPVTRIVHPAGVVTRASLD